MKQLIIPLALMYVIVLAGCTQNPTANVTNNTNANNTNVITQNNTLNNSANLAITAASISSDVENALNETNNINVNNTGDAITPITANDLNTD